jgi:hypothetical protein
MWLAGCRAASDREPAVVVLPRPFRIDGGQCELRPLKWHCGPDKRCGPTWNDAVSIFRDVCAALKRDRSSLPEDEQGRELPIGNPELFENCEGLNVLRFVGHDFTNSYYYDSAGSPAGYHATGMFGEMCVGRAPHVSSFKGVSCTARSCNSSP